jgi:hypothetical protein
MVTFDEASQAIIPSTFVNMNVIALVPNQGNYNKAYPITQALLKVKKREHCRYLGYVVK